MRSPNWRKISRDPVRVLGLLAAAGGSLHLLLTKALGLLSGWPYAIFFFSAGGAIVIALYRAFVRRARSKR